MVPIDPWNGFLFGSFVVGGLLFFGWIVYLMFFQNREVK